MVFWIFHTQTIFVFHSKLLKFSTNFYISIKNDQTIITIINNFIIPYVPSLNSKAALLMIRSLIFWEAVISCLSPPGDRVITFYGRTSKIIRQQRSKSIVDIIMY